MFDFTTEQVEFLESSGKVVLHACPGSGKTTIVARKLANYLQCWNRPHQGIAVLSFTNVASDEIRHQATEMLPEGYCVDDPHFIGTLDSFIDNFIFLRFGYATYIFSDTNKDKKANNASGPFATYNKKPVLFLYDKDTAEDLIIQRFKEECTACDISVSPDKVAIVTRSKIHSDDSIDNLWKTPETELLARASFEWMCDNRKKAYVFCERALFQMVVKDLKDIDVSIEWDVSQIIQYAKWKQVVIEILIRLPSADEECGQWVTNSRDIVHKILVSHNVAMRDGITMNDAIKIKTRDKKHPDFRKIPIRCYFEIKSKAEYTYSSIHGVKGETFDALMLLIHGTVGNTLTPSFLANGKTNTELMRIAYVAMTRPRKLLVVAMPKNKAKLSNRFPPDKWDYVEL